MTHASSFHRKLDAELAERLARDGGSSSTRVENAPGHGGVLLPSRSRLKDLRSMNDQRAAKVLFAQLTECTSARGTRYMKGWAGASNLVAFQAEPDEQGRPVWRLYLAERQPRDGASAKPSDTGRPVFQRQERVSVPVERGGVDPGFDEMSF
jgi:hypothetical protein